MAFSMVGRIELSRATRVEGQLAVEFLVDASQDGQTKADIETLRTH